MVNIQQTINQSLSIAGLLYSQTAGFKARQDIKAGNIREKQMKDLDKGQEFSLANTVEDAAKYFVGKYEAVEASRKANEWNVLKNKYDSLKDEALKYGSPETVKRVGAEAAKDMTDMIDSTNKILEKRDAEEQAQWEATKANSQVSKVDEASNNAQNSMVAAQEERRNARQPGRQHIDRMGRTKYIPADWRRSK